MQKWSYYVIQWTWGIVMNLIGAMIFIAIIAANGVCAIVKHRSLFHIYKYRNAICMVVPWNCGGVSFGMFFVRGKNKESICSHEYGHGIQNLWWGPLFLFVIAIPSVTRYFWRKFYRTFIYPKNRKKLPPYDSIWFEGQATNLGQQAENNKWRWL